LILFTFFFNSFFYFLIYSFFCIFSRIFVIMNRVGLAVLTVFLVMAKLVIESPPNRKSHESSEELLTTSRMLSTPEIPEVLAISEMRGMPGIGDGLVIAASGINTLIIDGKPWGGRERHIRFG